MKRFVGGIAAVIVAFGLTAGPLSAQFVNSPMYIFPTFSPGVSINVDGGLALNDDAKMASDDAPISYGGQVMVGGAVGYVYAGFHLVDPKDPNDPAQVKKGKSFGGGGALALYNQGSQGFVANLQLGVGSTRFSFTDGGNISQTQGLLAVSAGFAGGSETATFEVYAAPRVQMVNYKAEVAGISGRTRFGYGASGGVNVTFSGFGIFGAVDWSSVNLADEGSTADRTSPLVAGVGVRYHFMMPQWGTAHGLIGG